MLLSVSKLQKLVIRFGTWSKFSGWLSKPVQRNQTWIFVAVAKMSVA